MKKIFLATIVLIGFSIIVNAQVKVGNNPTTITPSAVLDVESTNKGVIFPRVPLTSATDVTTIASPATGLLVYNTGTGGLSPAGYYFWNGSKWVNLLASGSGSGGSGEAQYVNFRIVTGTYSPSTPATVNSSDYLLLLRYDGASTGSTLNVSNTTPFLNPNATLILPDPATCPGRVLRLVNDSHRIVSVTGTNVYTNYPMYGYDASYQYTQAPSGLFYSVSTGGNGAQWVIFSDGVRWISLNVVII